MDALTATSRSVVITDATRPDNPIVYVNAAFSALCGYSAQEILGQNCRFLQGPDTDPLVRAEIRGALAAGIGIRREVLNYRKDGTSFWNDVSIDPINDAFGQLTGFVGIQHQADAVRRANQEKTEAESKLAIIADRVPGYIFETVLRSDGSSEILYCSPSVCNLLGVDERELTRRFHSFVHPDDRDRLTAALRRSAAEMSLFREEFRLVSTNGNVHWLRSDAPPRRLASGDVIWDGLTIEIGAEKRWQNEIARQALRDPLTGLLTRAAWRQALTIHLNGAIVSPPSGGVICFDITELSVLNDRFGQHVGDEILCETARRLLAIAESASGVAARIGGDEFAVLAPDCPDEDALLSLTHSASCALSLPISIGGQAMTIQTRIGATLSRDGAGSIATGTDPAGELMMQAELALRWAKEQGRDGHILYSRERDDRFRNRRLRALALEYAIQNHELALHYQPLVDLASGRILSAEALLRWHHPILGLQRPDLFIPLAETSGLIGPLGRWVLEEAFRQRGIWQDQGLLAPPIAINVSGIQLLDPGFVACVEQSLLSAGAHAEDFEIELTESLLIEPSPQVLASLNRLRTMGFTITIDDFGSGHASFRYLRDFPVDKVKIDQSFVRQLVLGSTDALIIQAVISLARSMEIGFVAEGIETEMQRDFLLREGCVAGQGALFSMPLSAEDFARLLTTDTQLPLCS
jgi:diguanylate cyclase (GGDEF)-like protein/PAS domain S-box-containing protein